MNQICIGIHVHSQPQRFGAERRTLEPLYSLSDFGNAMRREVVEMVGPR